MSVSIVNGPRASAAAPRPAGGAQTKPPAQEPTESVTYATSFGRFSHLANRVNALDTLDQSDRASLAGQVLKSVQDELQRLASENTPHAPGRTSELNIEQLRAFGSAFSEMLTARIEAKSLGAAIFMRLDPDDARLLGRISDAMQLAELKNHCASVREGIHDGRDAIAHLKQRYADKLKGIDVDEGSVSIERPRPGIIRLFVSDEIFDALNVGAPTARALAASSKDFGGRSLTIYRSSLKDDPDYRQQDIPHETMHTFFHDTVARVLGIERTEKDLMQDRDFSGFCFARYVDEAIAQAVGGVTHSYSALLQHSGWALFQKTFAEHDRKAFDSAKDVVRELYDLFHDSDLTVRMRHAGLSSTSLVPLFVSSSGFEDLRNRLMALYAQLPEVPQSQSPGGGWGTFEV